MFGAISMICGIISLASTTKLWFSATGAGLWIGLFILIAGVLCIFTAKNPDVYATRCAAMTFCIISVCLSTFAGLTAYVAFM